MSLRRTTALALDVGDGAPQFGGGRAELVSAMVAVARLAGLFQAVGGGTETNRADRQRHTLKSVRGRGQACRVGGAQGPLDRLLGLDSAVAELLQ
jgi:hypothetical protein